MPGDVSGRRILIVEDEYFIAADLGKELARRGGIVLGPVGDLRGALSLLSEERVDAAVLDVNLEGSHSYPVMEELARQSVPFMLLTGYDEWALPKEWRSLPRITKPAPVAAIVSMLSDVLEVRGS